MKKTLALALVTGLAFGGSALAEQAGAPGHAGRGAKLLAHLDQNADGKLSRQELQAKAIGRFDAMDANKDGKLSKDEAAQHAGVARKPHAHIGARGERRFTRADMNNDGVVERTEVLQLSDARFTKLDTNGDGSVEQSELKGHHKFDKKGGRCHGREKTESTDKV